MKQRKIIIIGAGIAGLVCALELLKKGCNVTIIEKENKVGGLARSFDYNGIIFDIGPHRFFSNKQFINNYIINILDYDLIKINRNSAVFFNNRYFAWPLSIFAIFQMPFTDIIKIIIDIFMLDNKKITNYKEYIENRYGKTLYEQFFKSYTEKFFNIKADKMSYVWAEESINRVFIVKKMTGIYSVIKYFIKNCFIKEKQFIYPSNNGIQTFSNNLLKQILALGGTIELNANVNAIEVLNNKISSVKYNNSVISDFDAILWTAPVTVLASLSGINVELKYRSLMIFNLVINKKNIKNKINSYQWCYFGDTKITLNRISKPNLFSKNNISSDYDSICVEISCSQEDYMWNNSNSIKDNIINELITIKAISSKDDIINIYIEKIENVYPIYTLNFQKNLNNIKKQMSKIKNLYLAGRSALFWYNNMDDSIENALSMSNKIYENK